MHRARLVPVKTTEANHTPDRSSALEVARMRPASPLDMVADDDVCLPQPPRLAFPLHQHEDVALADRPLDVTHNGARRVVEELNANLRDATGLAGAAQHLRHLRELDGLILRGGSTEGSVGRPL